MKISEFTDNSHIDEISAGEVGAGIGKATRAVGSGIKNFAKGFAGGATGKVNGLYPGSRKLSPEEHISIMKTSITKFNPKQIAALRTQLAKKAGVA